MGHISYYVRLHSTWRKKSNKDSKLDEQSKQNRPNEKEHGINSHKCIKDLG